MESRQLYSWKILTLLAAVVLVPAGLGCGDDDDGPTDPGEDLVTITGTVINVDDLTPAEGVRVSLFETEYADDRATGSEGQFVLRVPRESELVLVTDDFDSGADEWFRLINVENPQPIANDDISDFTTHCCPNSEGATSGSVAIWDSYLTNQDSSNGDLFDIELARLSRGVVTVLGVVCDGTELQSAAGFELMSPGLPFIYFDVDSTFNAAMDATFDRHVHFGAAETDPSGWAATFLESPATEVSLSISDHDKDRGLEFVSPITVPVREGTISLVWYVAADGVPNSAVDEILPCFQ